MEKLYLEIQSRLERSITVCLISDIWSRKQMLDFMGLAACTTNNLYENEVLVIGMCLMPGSHSSEFIKEAIESLVNRYKFDKSIIHGMNFKFMFNLERYLNQYTLMNLGLSSDEGSAYVKCFK